MKFIADLFRLGLFFVTALAFGTYLAVCDWLDSRKSNTDAEGSK